MSLKLKEISRLLAEAKPILENSVMQRIFQVKDIAGGESFVFQGFGSAGGWRIWASLFQDHTCFVLADSDWVLEAFSEPSTLVMVMRKHLVGQRIVRLEQIQGERIVLMHFETGPVLLFELLPKRANIVLGEQWEENERSFRFIQSFRQVSLGAGAIYQLPPPPKEALHTDIRSFDQTESESYHQVVARHYWDLVQQSGFTGLKRLWRQTWRSHSKKLHSALKNSEDDFAEALEAQGYQKMGMALVAHLYELGPKNFPKEKKIEIDGIEVVLDTAKTYSENSDNCFRKAKKMHRAIHELQSRIGDLTERCKEADRVLEGIDKAPDEEGLHQFSEFFAAAKIPLPEVDLKKVSKEAPSAKPFLEVQSSDGFRILCGRNQEENRKVTFQESKGNDLWVHLKGAPGAHVVIKSMKNKTVPLSTLLEAAQICLYHSKIRKGKRAEVDYTFRKYVRAIKGTPAEVTYTGNKTLYVEADPEELKKLLKAV